MKTTLAFKNTESSTISEYMVRTVIFTGNKIVLDGSQCSTMEKKLIRAMN
jgi:hypothetical protein